MPASFCLALRTISQRVTMLTPSKRSVESLHLLRSSPGPESNWISMEETVLASSRYNKCSLIVATFEGLFVGALLSQLQGDEAVMRGDLTMDIYEEMCVRQGDQPLPHVCSA